jgi:hypothetical protein
VPSCNKVRSEIKPGVMPYALQLCLYLFVAGVMPYIVFAVTLLSSIATVYLITVHRPAGARKEEFVGPPSCAFWQLSNSGSRNTMRSTQSSEQSFNTQDTY